MPRATREDECGESPSIRGLSDSVFDPLAGEYDTQFTHTLLGTLLRKAVWRRLDRHFKKGHRVLEVNCGTGEDALFLAENGVQVLATDASYEMVQVARRKVMEAGFESRVRIERLALEDLATLEAPPFDGVLSNFGGLNCVADLSTVARQLAMRLRTGAMAVLVVMGPLVPWEWIWFLGRGRPRTAFRRLRPGGVEWRGLKVRYPTMGRVRKAFSGGFHLHRAAALGVFLPPPYAEKWATKHGRLIHRLNRWERRWETLPPLPRLADHYLLEMERL